MKLIPSMGSGLLMLLFQACATPVWIVDSDGRPIQGARIEPYSLSINYEPVVSDGKGRADILWQLKKVEWINVSRKGYETKREIKIQSPGPLRVVLKR